MIFSRNEWIRGQNAAGRIEHFLDILDKEFVPPLSNRVVISDYARKLAECADTIFLLDNNGTDIASCSIYCNQKQAYISSIAVMKKYRGSGLGRVLMDEVIQHVEGMCDAIALHVHKDNEKAIAYYKKYNYKVSIVEDVWIKMIYDMR